MSCNILELKEYLKDTAEWFADTVPVEGGKWLQGDKLIEANDVYGLCEVEVTFHLVDGTALTARNKALESWKEERRVGDYFGVHDDYLEINDKTIIPLTAIAYIEDEATPIDWLEEIAKKEREKSREQQRITFDRVVEVKDLWHTADEKPQGDDNHILIQFKGKVARFTVFQVKELQEWKGYTDPMFIERWCYIEDLLPKDDCK